MLTAEITHVIPVYKINKSGWFKAAYAGRLGGGGRRGGQGAPEGPSTGFYSDNGLRQERPV